MLDIWYSYRDFNFTREQMIWAIEYLDMLASGIWPPEGRETGYTDTVNVQSSRKREAKFIKPALIAAEVEWRLKRTGIEGKLLVAEIRQGLMLEELQLESRRALNYISGKNRRKQSYQAWKKQRVYRKNEYQKVFKTQT